MRLALVALLVVVCRAAYGADDDGEDITEQIDLGDGTKSIDTHGGDGDGDGKADDEEDVTEQIDLGGGAPAPVKKPRSAPVQERIEARAWLRVGTWLGLDRAGQYQDAPDPFAVPHDRLVGQGQIHMRMRYQRGEKYEIVASGLLDYGLFEQDAKKLLPFTGVNGQATRTQFEGVLREAYVGFYWKTFDLRVGNQRLAWGRGDMFAPNDIVNPRDLRDPVLGETELSRLPSFVVRADIDSGPASLQLIVQPFFTPNRFDVYGTNWAAMQEGAPEAYRGFMRLQTGLVDPTLQGALQPLFGQTELPEDDLSATAGGARFRWSGKGFDGSYYLHYGFDPTPKTSIDPMFAGALAGIDFTMATPSSLGPVLDLLDMGVQPTSSVYVRRLHHGFDLETVAGQWVLRLDGAYDSQMVFTRRDTFEGLVLPSLQIMGAAEYQTGVIGQTVLFELSYQRLESKPPPDGELLGVNANNLAAGAYFKWQFFDDQLGLEVRAVAALAPAQFMLMPRMVWKVGNTAIHFGLLLLDGEENSMAHYYRFNRGFFTYVKYSY